MNNPDFKHSIEITKEAFELLKGNDEKTCRDFANNELAEWTTYVAKGHRLMALHDFVSNVTKYYMQDINA